MTAILPESRGANFDYKHPFWYIFAIDPEIDFLMQDVSDYALERIDPTGEKIKVNIYNTAFSNLMHGNAFISGVTGNMYFDLSLIRTAKTLDALAGIVLHELSHVKSEDFLVYNLQVEGKESNVLSRFILSNLMHFGALVLEHDKNEGGAAGLTLARLLGVGLPVHEVMEFGRQEERNADYFALQHAPYLGYEKSAIIQGLQMLAVHYGVINSNTDWYYSHPALTKRIDQSSDLSFTNQVNLTEEQISRVKKQKSIFDIVKYEFLIMNHTPEEVMDKLPDEQNYCLHKYLLGYANLFYEKPGFGISEFLEVDNNCQNHNLFSSYAFTSYHLARGYLHLKNIDQAKYYALSAAERMPNNDFLKVFLGFVILQNDNFNLRDLERIVYTLPESSVYLATAWRLLAMAYGKRNLIDLHYLSFSEFNLAMAKLNLHAFTHKDINILFSYVAKGFRHACLANTKSQDPIVRSRAQDIMYYVTNSFRDTINSSLGQDFRFLDNTRDCNLKIQKPFSDINYL